MCVHAKLLQLCLALCDPMDYSPPGSPVHGDSTLFNLEFCNKEFMIWATVSSKSCFYWLYRAFPSLAAKNTINLILVLTIWSIWSLTFGDVHVYSHLLGCWKGCLLWPACSPDKILLDFPCFILYWKVTLPASFVYDSGYLLTSYFCIPTPYD